MLQEKENAAKAALDFVESEMVLGLGSGSTAELFIEALGVRIAAGLKVRGIPTSETTRLCAQAHGVPLIEANQVREINLAIDGADEVDEQFQLIKGGGGCLLREKMIAQVAQKRIIVVDQSKLVSTLGQCPLPVEMDPFAVALTAERVYGTLKQMQCDIDHAALRQDRTGKTSFVTDGGHYILDCHCRKIPDPVKTAKALNQIAGVIENGLFINMADIVIVGQDRQVQIMEIDRGRK